MKVELIKPEVEPDVQITMTQSQACVLRRYMYRIPLCNWQDLAEQMGYSRALGEEVNGLYYQLSKITY